MSDVKRYWVRGMMWFTREDCERECRSIHARLGVKECPEEVVKASDYATLEAECRWAMESIVQDEELASPDPDSPRYIRAQAWLDTHKEG